ncbi:MAG: lysylphosphatidylglycerol synthase domain-containing protein [Aquamicrobium sp.]|uniref:lysylphosphatidylglycerol synthase domain-containing protein n=1 Tax=Aquamicrobium sp. TaxID=1872579 RepID=UPI00349F0159|nr:lysylphosphatidylglycerol synthase domain-containing protein [Aquamicrobium sp.]
MPFSRLLIRLGVALAIGGAAVLLYRALSRYTLDEITASVAAIPAASFAGAAAFAAASYLCLTGFDWLALRYAGKPLAWRRAALASFVSLSIGHNIGVAALSSGAIRYRFYTRWGLDAGDVAKVILFSGATVGLGLATLGGFGLLLYPAEAERLVGMGRPALTGVAAACLAVPVLYLAASAFVRGKLRFRRWTLDLPALPLAAAQVAVGTLNFACVAACLHRLLAAFSDVSYLEVAAIYVIGNVMALVSHVPGGLGVLEATVLYLLPGGAAIGALIAFRVVYFFVPLAFGLPLLLASEYALRGASGDQDARRVSQEKAAAASSRAS